jgi:hypothetical protein
MGCGEIDLELRPCFPGNCSSLPRPTRIGKQSRVKDYRVCNINDHCVTIRLPSCYRKGSRVLDLLEEHLDQLIRIVNPSGKTGTQIPQLSLGDNSSPWGDNAVCT